MDNLNMRRAYLIDFTNSLFRLFLVWATVLEITAGTIIRGFDVCIFEVVTIFYNDCDRLVDNMEKALEPENVDFGVLDSHVHQLKGSSSSIGAARIKNVCIAFKSCCQAQNREECLKCLQKVKDECAEFKIKLQMFCELEQLYVAAGGSLPVLP